MASYPPMQMLDQNGLAAFNAAVSSNSLPNIPVGGYPPIVSNSALQYQTPQSQYSAATAAAIAAAASAAANYQQQAAVAAAAAAAASVANSGGAGSVVLGASVGSDPKSNLIVNYLPQSMSQDEFKALFTAMGEVESCKLVKDKLNGQSLGYGFVNYVRSEDAQKAVSTLNGMRLQNKLIKVSYARPSSENIKGANLYISGIPKTMTQAELEGMFVSFGRIITTRILTDTPSGQSKGVGFVRFDNKNEAEMAIAQLNGTIPAGGTEPITVKFANNPATANQKTALHVAQAASALVPFAFLNAAQGRRLPGPIHSTAAAAGRFRYSPLGADILNAGSLLSAAAASAASIPPPSGAGFCIFVFNLAPETDDSILWQLFGPFGAVLSVKVIRDFQTSKCKGYGFVTMAVYEEALAAITHLHGTTLAGRVLQISFKSQSNRKM